MTVFISYRHSDRNQALEIDKYLNRCGVPTYLDVLDTESQSSQNITEVITRNVARSSHMIAVISHDTAKSWWVPFEIGEATISDTRIASFKTGYTALPEFLKMWPQMSQMTHMKMFVEEYKRERSISLEGRNIYESIKGNSSNADNFHQSLKGRISRGY
ncbi:toll/interleukin-1 receptor domain-containing protein [Vibrio lentus]|uniref:Molecular chaperone Tir n=1 Tax=Vibrio lentus TaxID=136468 RepID=A0AA44VWL3_9VIBR|nr:toll/interleukin-1 receptor domain-containing protein [Vibrio lentus]MCB5361735.1 toll/interleukin-1 receptor domain-containing protein [Vibrio lentus]MCB5447499.1 toll/interleukin-1 receptor domain-containing protein [Vibrio lentus]MCB5464122.1 toll/interleukin-1 receptor domain-containing protein [Vibrio lentus]MCC4793069.1 toll/interleukin-1 receptor domain-containing protein [Vibrio lentus]MCC4850679.1 toll/interleukin-1 receptor domain-containing protein [Vibrio lentus]